MNKLILLLSFLLLLTFLNNERLISKPQTRLSETFETFFGDGIHGQSDVSNIGEMTINVSNTADANDVILFDRPILSHPRLLFTESEEKEIIQRIPRDSLLTDLIELLRKEADKLLDVPLIKFPSKPVNVNNTMLNISRSHLYRIITLGMAYRIFKETIYAEKAIDHILNVCSYPTWNPSHFLDVAEMSTAVAIGYDWLYPVLTDSEREIIISSLKEKALNLAVSEYSEPGHNSWSTRETNWNTVCNAGMSLSVLAIAEEFEKDELHIPELVINHAVTHIPENLKTFKPDGVAYEGPGYAQYTINYYSMLSKTLHDNIGNDKGLSEVPGIKNFGNSYYQTVSPNNRVFNFGDSSTDEVSKSPFYFFYSKILDQSHLATFYRELIKEVIDEKVRFPQSIFFLSIAWYDDREFNFTSEDKPLTILRSPVNPIAIFNRNASSPHSIYLIAKGGKPNETHQHLDMGSFIVENQGVRWFDDIGQDKYSLPGFWERYPTGRRWKYLRNSSFSHNVPIIDNKIQYSASRATIERYQKESESPFVIFDLDSAYVNQIKSLKRGIKLLDTCVILLQDEFIVLRSSQQITESFLTRAQVYSNDEIITLEKEGKKFYLKVLEPTNFNIEVIDASTQISEKERSVSGFFIMRISTKETICNNKCVFKILISSDVSKIESMLVISEGLDDW